MRYLFSACFIFLSVFSLCSQDLPSIDLDQLFFGLSRRSPEQIRFVNGLEDKRIWNYERGLIKKYPDSIKNPEAIKFVSISYESGSDLEEVFKDLDFLPNLEYVEIRTANQFRKEDIKSIFELPENLAGIKNIRYLQLSGTYKLDLAELFEDLQRFENLEYLEFGNQLEEVELPENFTELQDLKGINLSGYNAWILPDDLQKMGNLNSVVLNANGYENLGVELEKLADLPNLTALQVSYFYPEKGELKYFSAFDQLERLEFFNVKFPLQELLDNLSPMNKITTFKIENYSGVDPPTDYTSLKQVEKFEISINESDFVPTAGFFELTRIRFLRIRSGDHFTEISERLGDLKKLEELYLSNNGLESLPASIGNLKELKVFEIQHNNIRMLPKGITQLQNLERFAADGNALEKLPEKIGDLKNLTVFTLNQNKIEELPASITKLYKLKELNLIGNDLNELPKNIGALKNLELIPLGMNFLEELPTSFTKLVKLQELHLSNNVLKRLPGDLGTLKNLQEIQIGNHERPYISDYTSRRGYFNDTTRLARGENRIKELPESISDLNNLKLLDLENLGEINEDNLWKELFELNSVKFRVDCSNCGITSFPGNGWEDFKGEDLYLVGNVIPQVPKAIIHAPYLQSLSFKRSENDGLNYSFRNKAQLLAFYVEEGFIPFESLPKTKEMAEAFLQNAYHLKYTARKEDRLGFMEKAFLLDSTYTFTHIRKDDYAAALLENNRYEKAIEFYTSAIQQDTSQGVRILNFIVPQFRNRAEAYMAIGDTLSALKDLETLSSRFSSGDWGEAALLARKIEKDSLAKEYFNKGEKYYQQRIQWAEEHGQQDYKIQLSLLELYIISEEFSKAKEYSNALKTESITKPEDLVLLDYLELVLEIVEGEEPEAGVAQLKKKMQQTKISGWSFDLLRQWVRQTDLDFQKKERILDLTNLLEGKED